MEATVSIVDAAVSVAVSEEVTVINVGNVGPQGPRGSQVLSGEGEPSPIIGLIGDQYIQTGVGKIFGPKTSEGWGTGKSLFVGTEAFSQVYVQETASTTWTILHTLDFVPTVVIVDSEQNMVEGNLIYSEIPPYTITAEFSQAIAGKAYLS